ncbi:MAG: hypothetical protein U1E65_19690 [Myxococcota bacterium]
MRWLSLLLVALCWACTADITPSRAPSAQDAALDASTSTATDALPAMDATTSSTADAEVPDARTSTEADAEVNDRGMVLKDAHIADVDAEPTDAMVGRDAPAMDVRTSTDASVLDAAMPDADPLDAGEPGAG